MKVSKKSIFAVLALAGTLTVTACTQGYKVKYYNVTGPYAELLGNPTAKSVYKSFLGSGISTLNYLKSQNAADSRHVANFVDGLVMNDEYTILRKQLAETVTHNDDYSVYTFNLKKGIKWYTWDGKVFSVGGKEQEVVADDFVKSAEVILNYNNQSDLAYLLEIFLAGGYEFYSYTMMNSLINSLREADSVYPKSGKTKSDGKPFTVTELAAGEVTPDCKFKYSTLKGANDELIASQLSNLIAYESNKDLRDVTVTADNLADIANFKRVGVKKGANEHELIYTLDGSMNYFPTVLTYCPFLPVNRAFYDQYGGKFGTAKDKILYNGPFFLNKWEGSDIIYKKNENYYKADTVFIDRVEYKVLEDNVSASYYREQFEKGNIDGFSLSKDDSDGWKQYLAGEDGKGTYEHPASGYVNARELDEIDFVYSFNVNLNRDTNNYTSKGSNSKSLVSGEEIANANRALHLTEVRKMIMDGLALSKYGEIFVDKGGAETADQYAINTIIPKGFARDEDGTDYVEYFFEEYATQKNISVEESRNMWKQQQYAGREYADTEEDYLIYKKTVEAAEDAIAKYNAAITAGTLVDGEGNKLTSKDKITYPIKFEALGLSGQDTAYKKYENALFEDLNEKTNGCRINADTPYTNLDLPVCENGKFEKFIFAVNTKVTDASTSKIMSNGAYYTLGLVWGWGPDYADPLTYANCYTDKGDMTKYLGYDGDTLTYYLDESGNIVYKKLAAEYTAKVEEAKAETADTKARYTKFAQAEYMLHEDLYVVKPVHMNTQGWTASVSRAAGYQNPTSSYGLAGQRLDGMWVLKEVPLAEYRAAARDYQKQQKEAQIKQYGYIAIY